MLTWRNVSCAAQWNFVDVFSVFPMLMFNIKGFHFADVMICEMFHHRVCVFKIAVSNIISFNQHFGKQVGKCANNRCY